MVQHITCLSKQLTTAFFFVCFLVPTAVVPHTSTAQQRDELDSIIAQLRKHPDDLKLLSLTASKYEPVNTDSSIRYAHILLTKAVGNKAYTGKAYQSLSNASFLKNDLDSAVFFLTKAIDVVKQGGLEYETAFYTQSIAQLYLNRGNLKDAVANYHTGLTYFLQHADAKRRDEHVADIYGGLGDCYNQLGLYDTALASLFKSLAYTKKSDDHFANAISYNSILAVYQNMKAYEKSLQYGELALQEFRYIDYKLGDATVMLNMATSYYHLDETDKALRLLDTAEKIIVGLNTTYNLGEIYTLYGDIYRKRKDYHKSSAYLQQAIAIHRQSGAKLFLGTAIGTMAQNRFDQGNKREAQQAAMQALSLFNEIGAPKEKSELLNFLVRSNIPPGSTADTYINQYLTALDEYLNERKLNAVTAQEIKYETTLKEATIAQQQTALQLGKQRQNWMLGGGSLALAAAAGLGWLYRKSRKQKALIQKQKQEILHNNRNSIQQLISIFGRQAHTEAEQVVAQANQERLMTLNLLNKMLYENTDSNQAKLNEYLQRLADAKSISTHIPVSLNFQDNDMLLRGNVLKDVGLIVNELISNSARHAFGNTPEPRISITTSVENNTWLLINYRDNGCGLPADFDRKQQQRRSFGMDFIYDLTEQHHGNIKWHNDSGACFNIRLKLV